MQSTPPPEKTTAKKTKKQNKTKKNKNGKQKKTKFITGNFPNLSTPMVEPLQEESWEMELGQLSF